MVWDPYGAEEFKQVTGTDYSLAGLYNNSQALSAHFGKEFLRNLASKPIVYLQNTLGNSLSSIFGFRTYEESQLWSIFIDQTEDIPYIFSVFNFIAALIALPVLVYSAFRKDANAQLSLLLLIYFALNYSIVFLTGRYLYALMPIMWIVSSVVANNISSLFGEKVKWVNHRLIVTTIALFTLFGQALPIFITFGIPQNL
jgi:hypothetical protein